MAAITEGRKAPSFTLPDAEGRPVSLVDFKGQDVVVYFYPRDDTPGCTKEACGFRDDWKTLQKLGAVVLGVSGDSEASHQKFRAKYKGKPEYVINFFNAVATEIRSLLAHLQERLAQSVGAPVAVGSSGWASMAGERFRREGEGDDPVGVDLEARDSEIAIAGVESVRQPQEQRADGAKLLEWILEASSG